MNADRKTPQGGYSVELLSCAAERLGFEIGPGQLDLFAQYLDFLQRESRKYNLTAIHDEREIVLRHFVDSLTALPLLQEYGPRLKAPRVVDIGSGAGFPGLPLRIMRPELDLVLVDARRKRVRFLRRLCRLLDLQDTTVIHARMEELGREHRGQYDFALARAVAHLRILIEYALPCLCRTGKLIAFKGEKAGRELAESENALRELCGRTLTRRTFRDRELRLNGELIVVEPVCEPPEKYPRRPGIPEKRPL